MVSETSTDTMETFNGEPNGILILLAEELTPTQATAISNVLCGASEVWVNDFLELEGMKQLVNALAKTHAIAGKDVDKLRVQFELLNATKYAIEKKGYDELADQPELVALIALNLDSEDSTICTQTLEILSMIMLMGQNTPPPSSSSTSNKTKTEINSHSGEGNKIVMEAMDFFKMSTQERIRFHSIIDALYSPDLSFLLKRDILFFINTALRTASSLEERLEIRADMVYAGILPILESLRKTCEDQLCEEEVSDAVTDSLQEMQNQLQIFDVCLHTDSAECITDLVSVQATEVDLSDPEQIFRSLYASSVEYECFTPFLSTLQGLLAIPSYDSLGKQMWDEVEQSVLKILTKRCDVNDIRPDAKTITVTRAKKMLVWKERVQDVSKQCDNLKFKIKQLEESEASLTRELNEFRDRELSLIDAKHKKKEVTVTSRMEVKELRSHDFKNAGRKSVGRKKPVSKTTAADGTATASASAVPGGDPDALPMSPTNAATDVIEDIESEEVKRLKKELDDLMAIVTEMRRVAKEKEAAAAAAAAIKPPPPPSGESKSDAKAALGAMFAARKPPGETAPAATPAAAADGGGAGEGKGAAKAALGAMFAARKPPGEAAPAGDGGGGEGKTDAKAALGAMFAARKPPPPAGDTVPAATTTVGSTSIGPRPAVVSAKKPALFAPALPTDAKKIITTYLTKMNMKNPYNATATATIPNAPPLPGGVASTSKNDTTKATSTVKETPGKPKKPTIEPKVPMRAFFWSKIPDKVIDKTVWSKLSDLNIKLDIDALELSFCKALAKVSSDSNNEEKKGSSTALKLDKPKEVTLLDPKVQQNVGIALAKYRMPSKEIKAAIIAMDEAKLDLEKLNSLRTLAPTPDDISTLKEYDGDIECLGRVEQFFIQIIEIPRYNLRLDCFIFKLKFPILVQEARDQMNILNKAVVLVNELVSLKRIMEIVLAIGNYLNGGSPRGGVYGFKLEGLLKLATVKSVDNKQSLMNFLAYHCEKYEPTLLTLNDDLSLSEEASRVSIDSIRGDLGNLKKNLEVVSQQIELSEAEKDRDPLDRLTASLKPFKDTATKEIDSLDVFFSSLCVKFATTVEEYGEDCTKITAEEFFGLLRDFASSFEKARNENEKRRVMQEKADKKKAAEEKAKLAREAKLKNRAEEIVGQLKGSGLGVSRNRSRLSSRRGVEAGWSLLQKLGADTLTLDSPLAGPDTEESEDQDQDLHAAMNKLRQGLNQLGDKPSRRSLNRSKRVSSGMGRVGGGPGSSSSSFDVDDSPSIPITPAVKTDRGFMGVKFAASLPMAGKKVVKDSGGTASLGQLNALGGGGGGGVKFTSTDHHDAVGSSSNSSGHSAFDIDDKNAKQTSTGRFGTATSTTTGGISPRAHMTTSRSTLVGARGGIGGGGGKVGGKLGADNGDDDDEELSAFIMKMKDKGAGAS
eukprot:gene3111-6114_t